MYLKFYKYQGTGNDFILIDNRFNSFNKKNNTLIAKLCNRKFGVGADGLILLENSKKYDFKMLYFNADGKESTMCGNGGRCIVAFAKQLKIIKNNTTFEAIDGLHSANIKGSLVELQMMDVDFILEAENHVFLNTGSPHHINFESKIDEIDVKTIGKKIRYGKPYNEEGVNVNFVEQIGLNTFKVRTYERGVEDETLSCGTGVTAVAIAAFQTNQTTSTLVKLHTLGGILEISFQKEGVLYKNVFLKGDATFVFKGKINL